MRQINFECRLKQIHNFTRIQRHKNIMPMDIDGMIDYGGKYFLFLEGKVEGTPISTGQRLALENMVKSHWKAGHPSAALIYFHNTPVTDEVIVSDCNVRYIYGMKNGKLDWHETLVNIIDAIDKFEKKYILNQ